jgi:DNA polymerase-1
MSNEIARTKLFNLERILHHDGPVVIDIETPGQVDPYETGARVLMVGVALSDTEAYVFKYPYIKTLLKVLESESKPLIAHNAKFERNWLRKAYGFEGNFIVDTMLLAHYVNEQQPVGLQALAQSLFDAPAYDENIDYENEPWQSYSDYCELDCKYTYALYNLWKLRAQEPYFQFIMDFSQAVWDMEYNGIGFSNKACVDLQKYLWDLLQKHYDDLDCDGINLNSPQQVAKWLVESGVPLAQRTETGKLSVSEDATLELRAEYPIVDQYRKWKDINSLIVKYTNVWGNHVKQDGRIHASYFPLTDTGRHSAKKPNMQQVPRDPQHKMKRVFVPEEGNEMVSWDASQVELRVAAIVAPDDKMCQLFRDGVDIHAATAETIVGGRVTNEERQRAKAINFGFLYGMGATKFARHAFKEYGAAFSIDDAYAARNAYFNAYPGLREWHEHTEYRIRHDQFLTTVFGRTRHLDEVNSPDAKVAYHAIRQGINFLVQSPAADLTHAALITLRDHDNIKVVASVHDSIVWEQPEGTGDTIAETIMDNALDVLQQRFDFKISIPFDAEWTIGDHWT